MTRSLVDESADPPPANAARPKGSGRKGAMLGVAVAAIGLAIWMASRSLSEPSGTRPLDEGSASIPPPPSPASVPKPASAPKSAGSTTRQSAPAK